MAWTYEVEAHNTATRSTNRMHDDAVAATYGFRGGLVPGVDVWAYATRPCIDRWGLPFLERGSMDLRFVAPVYDKEPVTVVLHDDGDLRVCGADGGERATGTAALSDPMVPQRQVSAGDLPESVPPAAPERLTPGTVLGTLVYHHRAEPHGGYLADVRETSPVYDGGSICHPGHLARQANYVLSSSVQLGPWIHVRTAAQHRRLVRDGERVEVRGVVTAERERRGHRYVDLDVEISADGEPAWSASHTAIWQPRAS